MDGGGNFCRGIRSDANFQFFSQIYFSYFFLHRIYFVSITAGQGRAGPERKSSEEVKSNLFI